MKQLERYLKGIAFFLGVIFLESLLFSIFHYFGIFEGMITNILTIGILMIFFFLMGSTFGKKASSKGFLEGLKIGGIFVLLLLLLNLIFYQTEFSITRIIYYVLLLLASIGGSIVGINHQKK